MFAAAGGAASYGWRVERFADPDPDAVTVPVAALVLACGAAVALGVGPRVASVAGGTEALLALIVLAGWGLVVWAAVLGGGCVVRLLLSVRSRRPVPRSEIVITVAALVLLAAVVDANALQSGTVPG